MSVILDCIWAVLTLVSFAEMITGYPLFRGRDNADQLVQIMKIVGTPSDATLQQIKMNSVRSRSVSRADLVARDPDEVSIEQTSEAALPRHRSKGASRWWVRERERSENLH